MSTAAPAALAPPRRGLEAVAARVAARGLLHAVLVGLSLLWLLPTVGLFVSSLRPAQQIATSGWWKALSTPFSFTLENYGYVLSQANMGRSFLNSLIIAIPSTVMPILVAAFAAYAFSWMRFPGRNVLFLVVVGLLVVPLQVTLIPVLRMFVATGISGTVPAVWIAHSAYGLPFAIYLLRSFMDELPVEMMESAALEGASHAQIFFKLVLPTSVPAVASLVIFQFMWVWNDLLVALIYLAGSPAVQPMTVTISSMVNSYGGGWEYLTAAAFISMMLPLVVFFALQRYFVRGILAGSVKG
ncbi:MAG TPA: carbohydrate ABC transporter permease [Anaeromyxobacter sp.]|nr:carbohydrate ABC transporter permease [Anaeromyxobacter sp.]